jgi:LSD1 subclass zinc finger protein
MPCSNVCRNVLRLSQGNREWKCAARHGMTLIAPAIVVLSVNVLTTATSGLPVTWEEEIFVYCRGFGVFGACAARLYSASVSAIISVRASCPGCSMMLITS